MVQLGVRVGKGSKLNSCCHLLNENVHVLGFNVKKITCLRMRVHVEDKLKWYACDPL